MGGIPTTVPVPPTMEEIIERVEAVFAPFEDRLPAQARDITKKAHVQAKDARTQLRNLRPTAVA